MCVVEVVCLLTTQKKLSETRSDERYCTEVVERYENTYSRTARGSRSI